MSETGPGRLGPLRRLWRGWKRVGKKIGDVQARLLLTLFYFVLVAPCALVVRATSDPLSLRPTSPRGWRERPASDAATVATARRQF
jgi:hypothetical protein